jgi:alpha-N-acetylglucosaminidase
MESAFHKSDKYIIVLNNSSEKLYDLMLELDWHTQKVEVNDWIKKYAQYRYGTNNDTLQRAWQIFIQTVYRNIPGIEEGLPKNIFCARPAWGIKNVSTWGSCKLNYDTNLFETGVNLFLSTRASMVQSKTYFIDAIDFLRQVLANHKNIVIKKWKYLIIKKIQCYLKDMQESF